jgi:amino acid adenylation domain-containing protein
MSSTRDGSVEWTVPAARPSELGRSWHTSPATVLGVATMVLLARYSGERDVELALTRSGQDTTVLRADITAGLSFVELLRQATGAPHGDASVRASLTVRTAGDTLVARLDHDGRTPRPALGHLLVLLDAVADDPDRPVLRLPLLTPTERRQLASWQGPAPDHETDLTVPALFAEQVRTRPDAIALTFGGGDGVRALRYAELDERAEQLADVLADRGVRPGVVVGVCLERGAELVVAMLGVLKAGGAYLPLDPDHPPARLAALVADAPAALVVTDDDLLARLPPTVPHVVVGTHMVVVARDAPVGRAARTPAGPGDLACVMYTSGSTGRPKGVLVEHRSVVRLCRAPEIRPCPDDVVAQLASTAFDAATYEIWGALGNGARLAIGPPGVSSVAELAGFLASNGVTTLWLTAGLWQEAVDADPGMFAGLRRLVAGGDVLSAPHCARLLAALPELELVNGYGPTEGTTFSTYHRVRPGAATTVPIGRPLPGTTCHVVDRDLNLVPVGLPGELLIGGAGLARGYVRAAWTAERFVADPFGPPGARLYRTGDLVRWRPDGGVLEFLGRLDDQVKIRGFRVEPGEVEAALLRHPEVTGAVVVARTDGGHRRLVAYVVAPSAPGTDTLRSFLRDTLPDHLVPAAFVPLDRLPLTRNGKVDRAALPAPRIEGRQATDTATRPATERALAAIWAEVLRVDRIGPHDDFFALGGDSILCLRVVSRVRAVLRVDLSPRALFDHPTVAALAQVVPDAPAVRDVVPARSRGERPPMSFGQQRMWFAHNFAPDSAEYNSAFALRLTGRLDVPALAAAMTSVVERHEILRTTFADGDSGHDGGMQVVHPVTPVRPIVTDLSGLADPERDTALWRTLVAATNEPYDLRTGPLLRMSLVRLADREHVLHVGMHHIVSDGWSMGLLLRELAACYPAALAGRPPDLPALPVRYADFAHWQRRRFASPAGAADLDHWRRRLRDVPVLDLPTDRPRPAVRTSSGAHLTVPLPADVTAGLRALAARQDTTAFTVLVAATQVVLARYSGQDDVAVGTIVAGRSRAEFERLIGFFVNTVVLRCTVAESASFAEHVDRVRETVLTAFEHAETPFDRVVDALDVPREAGRNPLVQVLVVAHTNEDVAIELPGLTVAEVALESTTAPFDLMIEFHDRAGSLLADFCYHTDLFDAATVARFAGHLSALLGAVVDDADRPLRLLPLVGAEERRRLDAWNATGRDHPTGVTVLDLFDRAVSAHPDRAAVSAAGRTMSYRELDDLAEELAGRLVAAGVRPGARVCAVVEPGVDAVTAFVATAKIAAVYVGMEPDVPPERLRAVLADTAAVVVLRAGTALPVAGGWRRRPTGDDPLCCVYTSGSTGRPNGVLLTHGNLTNLIAWHGREFGRPAGERCGQVANLAFDAAVWELWSTLGRGGCLCVADSATRRDPRALARWVVAERLTFCFFPTVLGQRLVADGALDAARRLRVVVLGGDRITRLPGGDVPFRLINGYGPTEASVFATWFDTTGVLGGTPPIGRPLDGVTARILDRYLREAPVGLTGELYVGGAGVAAGYLGAPGRTAARFVADPFAATPGRRMYRTGDLARRRADGLIEFRGRVDRQVKIGGVRVELDEIEYVLGRHPAVGEVAVVAGEPGPTAYVTASGPLDVAALRDHARGHLPVAVLPARIVVLPALPHTATGKLDRAALPAGPEEPDRPVRRPPRTATERAVEGVWAGLLGRAAFDVHEKFFDAGGTSVQLVDLRARLERLCERELSIAALFEHSTIEAMARLVAPGAGPERSYDL